MEKQIYSENFCPCCGRHCSVDNLHCQRGKMYFESEGSAVNLYGHQAEHRTHHAPPVRDETAVLLLKCGHFLHHGLAEKTDQILSFLSDDEKNELTKLLNKCLEHWNGKGAY